MSQTLPSPETLPALIRQFRSQCRHPITNCCMLGPQLQQLASAQRIRILSHSDQGISFLVSENGYDALNFYAVPDTSLPELPADKPVMAELLLMDKDDHAEQPARALLERSGFTLYARCRFFCLPLTSELSVAQLLQDRDRMLGELRLRTAGPEDAAAVSELWRLCLKPFDFHDMQPDYLDTQLRAGTISLLYTPDGQPCGTMMLERTGSQCIARHFCVLPAYRGRGMGHAYNAHGIALAIQQGCRQFGGWINTTNHISIGAASMYLAPSSKVLLQYLKQK